MTDHHPRGFNTLGLAGGRLEGRNLSSTSARNVLDIGGITIGDRTMIGPNVTLSTAGHPVALAERYDGTP